MSSAPIAGLTGLTAGLVASRRVGRLREWARWSRLARTQDGTRALAALRALGVSRLSPSLLSLAIAVVRACDAEFPHRPYLAGEDDDPFVAAALERVQVPEGLPALYMLIELPDLVSTTHSGDILSQVDGLMLALAAAIVDATMDPAHAAPVC